MDPATATLLAEAGSQIVGAFGSGPDQLDTDQKYWQTKGMESQTNQARLLERFLRETFGDRAAMLMLQKLGMEFDLKQGKESWSMKKSLYNKAGEMFDAPGFDPDQNIPLVTAAIQPQMRSLQAGFAKRGMRGSGGEWAGMSGLQGGALFDYLINARERAFNQDRDWKKDVLGFQGSMT